MQQQALADDSLEESEREEEEKTESSKGSGKPSRQVIVALTEEITELCSAVEQAGHWAKDKVPPQFQARLVRLAV